MQQLHDLEEQHKIDLALQEEKFQKGYQEKEKMIKQMKQQRDCAFAEVQSMKSNPTESRMAAARSPMKTWMQREEQSNRKNEEESFRRDLRLEIKQTQQSLQTQKKPSIGVQGMNFKKPTQLGSTHWSAANIQNPFLKKSGSIMNSKRKQWQENDQQDDINNLLRDIES